MGADGPGSGETPSAASPSQPPPRSTRLTRALDFTLGVGLGGTIAFFVFSMMICAASVVGAPIVWCAIAYGGRARNWPFLLGLLLGFVVVMVVRMPR